MCNNRELIKIITQKETDIILYYNNGNSIKDTAMRYGVFPSKVKSILAENNVAIRHGKQKNTDGTSKREQIIAMVQNGIDIKTIAERLNTTCNYIRVILCREKTSIKKTTPLQNDVALMLQNNAELPRGWQSNLAEKYNVTRQAVNNIYRKLKAKRIGTNP